MPIFRAVLIAIFSFVFALAHSADAGTLRFKDGFPYKVPYAAWSPYIAQDYNNPQWERAFSPVVLKVSSSGKISGVAFAYWTNSAEEPTSGKEKIRISGQVNFSHGVFSKATIRGSGGLKGKGALVSAQGQMVLGFDIAYQGKKYIGRMELVRR